MKNKDKSKKLRVGYTTGVHTSFAFKSALDTFVATKVMSVSKTNKMDNDDLDVTKGCEIIVTISDDKSLLEISDIEHKPYLLTNVNSTCEVYAGNGVGVVTKKGLKPPKDYCAINPKPLSVLQELFEKVNIDIKKLFCTVSVTNGVEIAKQTANAKVGVLGGISILGTTGFVKPVSASAYIDSIEEELHYAQANNFDTLIFTLGNTAQKNALEHYETSKNTYIIEIGNFIYDAILLAVKNGFKDIQLWLGIAKCVKVAQGCKNTHNRFGGIDFVEVQKDVKIDIKECLTIKAVRQSLGEDVIDFDNMMNQKAQEQLKIWFDKDIKVKIW